MKALPNLIKREAAAGAVRDWKHLIFDDIQTPEPFMKFPARRGAAPACSASETAL